MKILKYSLLALLATNATASEIINGTILEKAHFISNENNATYEESFPIHTMSTSLGATAKVLKVATNYSYHTTTNHSVYIINDSNAPQTYYWYFKSCPQNFGCTTWGGAVALNPGGTYCESGTLQPTVKYMNLGFYENKAVTQTTGYDPKYVDSIAPIEVS